MSHIAAYSWCEPVLKNVLRLAFISLFQNDSFDNNTFIICSALDLGITNCGWSFDFIKHAVSRSMSERY